MALATIYPEGVNEITVPATESIAISNFGGGIAKIYYLIESANYPPAYQFQQTLENSSVTLGAFSTDTVVKIEANASKVIYDVGTAPDAGIGDADTLGGELPSYYTNASNINAGTLADGRLSTNIPKLSDTNVFTNLNTIQRITIPTNNQTTETDLKLTGSSNIATDGNLFIFIDADNNATNNYVSIQCNAAFGTGTELFRITENGAVSVATGPLTVAGAGIAYINATSGALQLPTLASDPASGESAGQIYYNTTSNLVRFYNGSAWGDI